MQNIAVFGVPRSGTSWLGQIFNSSPKVAYRYQPIFAYSFPGTLSAKSTTHEINNFHHELLKTDDEFVCQHKNINGNETPHFIKDEITHLVWKEVRYLNIIENLIKQSSTKVIGIIRHPCGVIKSWVNAPKEFDRSWNVLNEWRFAEKKNNSKYDYFGYECWIKTTRKFISLEREYPKQFRIVTYEALLNNLLNEVEELFEFAGLNISDQVLSFLEESTSKSSDDPYSVFRKKKDGMEWSNLLPESIVNKILKDERFHKLSKNLDGIQ